MAPRPPMPMGCLSTSRRKTSSSPWEDLSLGSFNNPVLLTPYSVFGVTEGESADNVLNLVRLLLTLDGDGNPDNGIQLNQAGVGQLATLSLADFDYFT